MEQLVLAHHVRSRKAGVVPCQHLSLKLKSKEVTHRVVEVRGRESGDVIRRGRGKTPFWDWSQGL